MRKALIVLASVVVTLGLFSPAEAAKKRYVVSGHADNRKMDLDSSTGGNRTTKIKGKVRGGKLKGKTVVFYATNTDTAAKKRRYLGSAKLSSKGTYSKTFRPSEAGSYLIEVHKKAGSGRAAATKKIRVEAFEWPILNGRFYNAAASNPDPAAPRVLVSRSDKEQTGTGKSPSERWSTSYAIHGTGKAVFDIAGFKCWRYNMKLAVSQQSPRGSAGTFVVAQGGREIARGRGEWGGRFWEPSRAQSEKLVSNLPLEVSIVPDAGVADPTAVRFVLGNPKASCTYPTSSTPYR
jgi:hypothetical protein